MKRNIIIAVVAVVVIVGGLYLAKTGARQAATTATTTTKSGSVTSNPQDVAAGVYPNKIANTSTAPGLVITKAETENIVGSGGKALSDHLQITVQNTTNTTINGFETYYTILDTKTQQKEGYYNALTDLSIPAGQSAVISFDGKSGVGHYPANPNSLFYVSPNKLQLAVEVSAQGLAPQNATVDKAAGGAEKQD